MTPEQREIRELKKHLSALTTNVREYLNALDAVMKVPGAPPERGQQIALLSNSLEMANVQARHFGLGIDLRTGKKPRAVSA